MASYLCPQCKADHWWADYYQAVHQGATLVREADGGLRVEDYHGDEETYDDGSTENEAYRCAECDYRIEVAELVFTEHARVVAPLFTEEGDEEDEGPRR